MSFALVFIDIVDDCLECHGGVGVGSECVLGG